MPKNPFAWWYAIVMGIVVLFGIAFAFKMAYLECRERLGRRAGFDVVARKGA